MDTTAKTQMIKARANLILEKSCAFFGALALRLPLVDRPEIETAQTDGQSIAYNPEYIEALTAPQRKGLAAHLVLHVALCHHTRRNGREPDTYNEACDYVVNPLIREAGLVLPDGALFPLAEWDGWSTDQVYTELMKRKKQNPEGDETQPDTGNDENGDSGPESTTAGESDEKEPGGSGATPDTDNAAPAQSDPGKCGAVTDSPAQGEAEKAQAEADTRIAVQQAAQIAKKAGALPAGLARLVDEIVNPKVCWVEILRRFMDQTAKNDYSWQRPNRRFIHTGLYLPGQTSEELGPIVVAIDTSASVSPADLQDFAAELTAILEECPVSHVQVLYCDRALTVGPVYDRGDTIELDWQGGGGTSFAPPIEWANAQEEPPVCLMYCTDGYGHAPAEPEYPVLWVLTGICKMPDFEGAEYGEAIDLNN